MYGTLPLTGWAGKTSRGDPSTTVYEPDGKGVYGSPEIMLAIVLAFLLAIN
jgi:hypothetical protein